MNTAYHATYFAHELTKRCPSDSVGKLAASLSDAQVDLNPHQVEAALFAFQSPLSKGAILADEVGLGKTIEAGILLSQRWAERKRRLLIIVPSNLRKQWSQELADKFFLPSLILEARSFNAHIKAGNLNPFRQSDAIVICSYQFARSKEPYVAQTEWDLVVIDEARRQENVQDPPADLPGDFENYDELEDEWDDESTENRVREDRPYTPEELVEVREEIATLREFSELARSIIKNSKGEVLLTALKNGFARARENGGSEKAIIFTESVRTQDYLRRVLEGTEFAGQAVLFNGTNNDPQSREIYARWLTRHAGTDRVSGSPTADKRAALVDYFRDEATIMIATEAAAEGINLQFCSLLVNFDLPWNPQRIEQRIGRCHRYGQKHDVVVVNFLNKANAADQRVFQLLDEKFRLFNGVFGASDEVLGAIESGIDFEKRIVEIYQRCRTEGQIEFEFDQLQRDLEPQIEDRVQRARRELLENFDEEVHEKLRLRQRTSAEYLDRYENWLWQLTRWFLAPHARFAADGSNAFTLTRNPFPDEPIHMGPYRAGRHVEDANTYRVGHPLAQRIIAQCKATGLKPAELVFDCQCFP